MHRGTDGGLVQLPDRVGIDHGPETRVLYPRLEQCGQQVGSVAISPATRVVGIVGHHDRTPVTAVVQTHGGRRFDGEKMVYHLPTAIPDIVSQSFGKTAVLRHIALRGDQHRGADLADIRASETSVDADRKNIWMLLVRAGPQIARKHRAHVGTPAIDFIDHRQVDAQRNRRDLTRHGALQDVARLQGGAAHVHVRIGAVRHDDVGVFTHGPAHIGV